VKLQIPSGLKTALTLVVLVLLSGCAASKPGTNSNQAANAQVVAPVDMPDICRDIDFNTADAGLREECGVITRNYKAYRNIPEHRNLLAPKNGKIVRLDRGFELRLESFLPADLPDTLHGRIEFGEKWRRQLLKTRYHYFEYFPPKESRPDKMIKIDIPTLDSTWVSACFFVERTRKSSHRKTGYASRLLAIDCQEWQRRKISAEQAAD
jgi:hypothetical protein